MKTISTKLGILIILAVAVVMFGGIFWYGKVQTADLNPESEINKTANWKKYKNDKYDFEFQYPTTFWVEETNVSGNSAALDIAVFTSGETPYTSRIFVLVYTIKEVIDMMPTGENNGVTNFKNHDGNTFVQISGDEYSNKEAVNLIKSTFKFTK